MNSPEKAEIKPIKDIDDFLKKNILYFDEIMKNYSEEKNKSWDMLNEFFVSEIE